MYFFNVAMENPTVNNTTEPNYNLIYVGHSMGSTMAFAMLSLRPEYNVKIHAGIALAPVAYMSKVKSPIRLLAPFSKDIQVIRKYKINQSYKDLHKVLFQSCYNLSSIRHVSITI